MRRGGGKTVLVHCPGASVCAPCVICHSLHGRTGDGLPRPGPKGHGITRMMYCSLPEQTDFAFTGGMQDLEMAQISAL